MPVGKVRRGSMVFVLLLVLASTAGACSSAPATSTSSTATTSSAAVTFGQRAQAGQAAYTASCASCHGADGQGVDAPALWGSQARLGKYSTAQGLLSYISATMPQDAPGSLEHAANVDILCYLLLQNGDAAAGTPFSEAVLPDLALK